MLLSVCVLISCSKDEGWSQEENGTTNSKSLIKENNEINGEGLNGSYGVESHSSGSNEWYFDIINSENPFAEFNRLTNQQKADFWTIKYEVFEINSDLSDEQLQYLQTLSDFVHDAHLNQSYDEEAFNILNKHILAVFNPNQVMDLIYYLDTPSIVANGCFWCDEVISEGPCQRGKLLLL